MPLIDATRSAFALLLSGDAALWQIIWVSVKTSLIGLFLAAPVAVVLGYAIATHRFHGRRIVIWLAQAALSLPTVLIGLLLYFIEDVGRHNAVDAIAGRMWLDGMRGEDKVFYTTGRLTSEMVIKGAQMGIPFLLSRSGTTQMGHMVAEKVGMALLARCTGKHFLLLTGHDRLEFEPQLLDVTPVLRQV